MAIYKVFVQAGEYSGHSDVFEVTSSASLSQIESALAADWITLEDAEGDECIVRSSLIWRVQEPNFIYEEE